MRETEGSGGTVREGYAERKRGKQRGGAGVRLRCENQVLIMFRTKIKPAENM